MSTATGSPDLVRAAAPERPSRIEIRDLGTLGITGLYDWNAFVERTPAATFFHRAEWAEAIASQFGYNAYYRMAVETGPDRDRVVGILPMHHIKTALLGSALISTAYFVYGGLIAATPEAARALADDAANLGQRLGVAYVELRSEAPALPDADDWPAKDGVYATFRREMAADPDERLKQIPRKKRADVRKAIKAAPLVEVDAPVALFHELYGRSLRDLGTPIHRVSWWQRIQETFGDAVEVSAIHGPSGPVSALLSFYDGETVLPYYAGALPEARRVHAFDYMYWMLMERAVARGARIFDFGRSKIGTGPYDYKGYWGFEPTPLSYQYHLVTADALPNVNPNNPKYRLFVENWKRLPVPLANRLGPWFARQLA
ncbi:MAG: FemAB family XrtA/PEP-CTERM system-associated protein [Pseudomonadota bacterium]